MKNGKERSANVIQASVLYAWNTRTLEIAGKHRMQKNSPFKSLSCRQETGDYHNDVLLQYIHYAEPVSRNLLYYTVGLYSYSMQNRIYDVCKKNYITYRFV